MGNEAQPIIRADLRQKRRRPLNSDVSAQGSVVMVAFALCPSLPVVMSLHSALPVLARRPPGLLPPSALSSARFSRPRGSQRSAAYSASPGALRVVVPTSAAASSSSTAAGHRSVSVGGRPARFGRARGAACALLSRTASASSGGLRLSPLRPSSACAPCVLVRSVGASALVTAMCANPSFQGTACRRGRQVPSALRAPAAPELQRWA